MGVELFNELAVNAFTPQAIEGFRKYLRRKYGDVETLNRVCRTGFDSFDAAVPPFLFDEETVARVREKPFELDWSFWTGTLARAIRQYPELWYEWVEFTRGRFAEGFTRLAESMRERYGPSVPITLQTREERVPIEGYQMVDIERIAPSLDFWGQQISNVLFYHYDGRPAVPETVKEAMNRLTFYPDFGRGVCERPIVNTECIVEGSFPAERDTGHMLARSITPLETEWKYQTDGENLGEKQQWFAAAFDDSGWPTVLMPNLRRTNEAKRFRGRVWYRYTFSLDARYQRLRGFAFKRFTLYLGALIPSGRVYLNSRLIHVGGGSKQEILLDVSDRLVYGGRNVLAVSIDNPGGRGGLDGPLALVDADDLQVKRFIDAGQTAALFWQHAVHGHCGVNFWQTKQPAINPEIIRTRLAIESVADVLLPQPRIRGQVAVLYPFESFRGIVRHMDDLPEFSQFMNVYAGLLFHHIPVDVLSCRDIVAGRHKRYPLLAIPLARMVRKGVFDQVLSYVQQGGTLLITRDSLIHDDWFYEALPLEQLIGADAAKASREGKSSPAQLVRRVGNGVVYYYGDLSSFVQVHDTLKKVLSETGVTPDADIVFGKGKEFPFVELQLIRQPPRFLVYLMNWGGTRQDGTLRLRGGFLGNKTKTYTIRDVRRAEELGEGRYTAERLMAGIPVSIPPQDPLVLLVEAEDLPALRLRLPADGRMAVIKRLAAMRARQSLDGAKPSVLFLNVRGDTQHEHGKAGSPVVVDLLEKAGCGVYERFASELSPDDLNRFTAVFIQEDYMALWRRIEQIRPEFWGLLRRYLEDGGSLFVAGTMPAGWNARSYALNGILSSYGIGTIKRYPRNRPAWLADAAHCVRGDALDVALTDIRPHPITRGVHEVQLHCAAPVIDRDGRLAPLVESTSTDENFPSQPVICAGEIGRGRLVVSGEPYFLQPFRIEQADNAKLIWNALRWLLRDRIPDLTAEQLQERFLFREADLLSWEAEEGR